MLVPERLAGLLGSAAGWSLKGWLDCWVVLLAGPWKAGWAAGWSLEGWLDCWLVPGGLAWLLGRAAMLVTAQLIFSVDT